MPRMKVRRHIGEGVVVDGPAVVRLVRIHRTWTEWTVEAEEHVNISRVEATNDGPHDTQR